MIKYYDFLPQSFTIQHFVNAIEHSTFCTEGSLVQVCRLEETRRSRGTKLKFCRTQNMFIPTFSYTYYKVTALPSRNRFDECSGLLTISQHLCLTPTSLFCLGFQEYTKNLDYVINIKWMQKNILSLYMIGKKNSLTHSLFVKFQEPLNRL